jgi:hypothetical protein
MLFDVTSELTLDADVGSDGETLFYRMGRPGAFRLVRRDLETGVETVLYSLDQPDARDRNARLRPPRLSPKGDQLAFLAPAGGSGRLGLFTLPVTGGVPHEIPTGEGDIFNHVSEDVVWTKDGRYVIAPGRTDLLAVPVEGGTPKPLGITMGPMGYLSFTPDGGQLLFSGRTRKQEFWVMHNLMPQPQAAR